MSLKWRDQILAMNGPDQRGWWTLPVPDAGCGDRYAFLLDEDATVYPDPRSLRQTDGVHGLSELYDHGGFEWHDQLWRGSPKTGAVIYELHIGTFSREGTFDSAIEHLEYLTELGVTHVEVMPVASWAGERGWGYDGVALFAPQEQYGGPDGFKRFVDACHAKGLSVVLDVVYNHFGPVGNYATKFGPYLNTDRRTPWGDTVNLDGEGSDEVRRFFVDNALMWLKNYHCDGLRFDAVHAFIDLSAVHLLEQMSIEVERLSSTIGREFLLIAESDLNDPRVVRPREANGYGIDAQWSDDFHHALFTVVHPDTENEAGYYKDFDSLQDLAKALRQAYVYTGQYSRNRKRRHGRPADGLSAHHFIHFDQNHDQVGNRGWGERLEHLVGMDAAKVSIGLLLMAPYIPMLFMGEEWAASAPFLYFADHEDEAMRQSVAAGRAREFASVGVGREVPNPEDQQTFESSKLNWAEQGEGRHAEMLAWVKALIQLRRRSVCLNDGDMHHNVVSVDVEQRLVILERDQARIVTNFGERSCTLPLLEGEKPVLLSRDGLTMCAKCIQLPAMTMAILMTPAEEVENRQLSSRER